jgi:hypothetical protein
MGTEPRITIPLPTIVCHAMATWLLAAIFMTSLYQWRALKRYVGSTVAIESHGDLERFKTMVAAQMRRVLMIISFLIWFLATLLAGLYMGWVGPGILIAVLFLVGFLLFPTPHILVLERKARRLAVPDLMLRQERDQINHVWIYRPYPYW